MKTEIKVKIIPEFTSSKIMAFLVLGGAIFLTAYLEDASIFLTSLLSVTVLVTGKQGIDYLKEKNAN